MLVFRCHFNETAYYIQVWSSWRNSFMRCIKCIKSVYGVLVFKNLSRGPCCNGRGGGGMVPHGRGAINITSPRAPTTFGRLCLMELKINILIAPWRVQDNVSVISNLNHSQAKMRTLEYNCQQKRELEDIVGLLSMSRE